MRAHSLEISLAYRWSGKQVVFQDFLPTEEEKANENRLYRAGRLRAQRAEKARAKEAAAFVAAVEEEKEIDEKSRVMSSDLEAKQESS